MLLFRMIKNNDRIPSSRWPIAAIYLLKSLFMLPLSVWERNFLASKIEATEIQQAPIFIVGHYRSGTTYLHKLMTSDKRYAYFSTFNFLFPYCPDAIGGGMQKILQRVIDLLKMKHLHFHNYRFDLNDPIEEDMVTIGSLMPNSAFLSEVFPKNALKHMDRQIFFNSEEEKEVWKNAYLYCLKKITRKNKGKQLILKNPPNTGRIGALLELFPDAKFILIYRNPYRVYYSTLNLWKHTLEKYYALHKITDEERDQIIFSNYSRLMSKFETDKQLIPDQNLVEIRYEDFEKDPFSEIKHIYETLNLPSFDLIGDNLRKKVNKEKSYTKYSYTYDKATQDKIYGHWHYFIDKWNYSRLDKAEATSNAVRV